MDAALDAADPRGADFGDFGDEGVGGFSEVLGGRVGGALEDDEEGGDARGSFGDAVELNDARTRLGEEGFEAGEDVEAGREGDGDEREDARDEEGDCGAPDLELAEPRAEGGALVGGRRRVGDFVGGICGVQGEPRAVGGESGRIAMMLVRREGKTGASGSDLCCLGSGRVGECAMRARAGRVALS